MSSKESLNKIQHHINGTELSGKELLECYETIDKALELLEALKQRWQQEEWCEGIELSVKSLDSLFKYNKDLFDKNLELDKKLAAEFEDSADELCKALTERDKLYAENQELKEEKKYYKDKYLDLYNSYQNCEDLKLKKAIDIIKSKCVSNTNLWLVVCSRNYEDYKNFVENKDHELVRIEHNILSQQEYDLLKEVLEK